MNQEEIKRLSSLELQSHGQGVNWTPKLVKSFPVSKALATNLGLTKTKKVNLIHLGPDPEHEGVHCFLVFIPWEGSMYVQWQIPGGYTPQLEPYLTDKGLIGLGRSVLKTPRYQEIVDEQGKPAFVVAGKLQPQKPKKIQTIVPVAQEALDLCLFGHDDLMVNNTDNFGNIGVFQIGGGVPGKSPGYYLKRCLHDNFVGFYYEEVPRLLRPRLTDVVDTSKRESIIVAFQEMERDY